MVNEWTRDDLPDAYAAYSRILRSHCGDLTPSDMCSILDLVLEHLNRAHPKPEPMSADSTYGIPREDYAYVDWPATCAAANERADRAESDRDRWRRAHEIVERERDQARDQWKKWEHKANEAEREVSTWRTSTESAHSDFLQAAHDRDEAVVRAEAAEARTAPAVTKRELRSVVAAHDPGDDELAVSRVNALTDRLWSLVSGADPAVFVVRESDLPEAWRDRDGLWRAGQSSYCRVTPEDMRSVIPATLGMVAARESVARAIEAEEEAVDPVEQKAAELWEVARPFDDMMWRDLTAEDQQEYRRIAAHVLGQEADDDGS